MGSRSISGRGLFGVRRLAVVPATLAVVASLLAVAPAPAAPAVAAKAAPSCTVSGTPGDDLLVGTPGDDVVCGRGGDDVLKGRGGDDLLVGGRGDDVLVGGGGVDRLRGGRGDDTLKGRHDGGASDDLNCGRGTADRAVADSADVVRASCELPNHRPSDLSLSNDAVAENRPAGTLVGRFSVVDPDAHDSHTFRLVPGPGSADNASFAIDGRRLRTAAVLDHEADPELTIRVRVTDSHGASRSERFRITVTDVDENGAPAAVDDAATTPEDTALELPASGPGSPAANDTDPNGDILSVVAVSGAEGGTVTLVAGTIRFEPDVDLCGVAAGGFDYTVSDGHDGTAVGHVTVDITCVDDPPHAVDDTAALVEGAGATAVDVLANDTDPDGGPMTIASVTQPAHGTVAITGAGSGLTYRPDAGYCDDAAPDPFTYTLNGGSTASVRVTVSCVDDPPHAVDDIAAMDEDAPATAIPVLANDTDPDGGPKTIVSVTQPANGTVVITGGGTGLTYQPAPDYCSSGASDSFTYTLAGGSTATVSVTVGCVPDPPVAVNDARTVTEDDPATAVDVLANDTDVDGGPKQVTAVTQPVHGTVVITGGGTGLTYQPDANYCNAPPGTAPDTFTYTLNGGSVGQVRMTVTCVDDLPTAVDDAATVTEDDAAAAIGVLGNDTDIDAGPITIDAVTQPTNGTVVITGGGAGLTYAPNANYCNNPLGTPDTFTYTLNGGSSATVSVTVTCVQDPPVAVDDATTVTEDDPATAVDVLANDTDVDGGPMSVTSVTQPANGTAVITGGGTGLTYQPDANYCNAPPGTSPDTFTYTLNGGSTGTVSVTVTCVDDAPTAVDDATTVTEDSGAAAVGVLANDANADGGPISVTSVTQPANGTVVITGGGTGLTYAPNANYCNTPPGTTLDTFTYTLTPGGSSATVTMTVTCVDDDPVAVNDATTVTEDDPATTIDVLANDTDVDGGTKAVTGVTGAAHGTVAITNSGADLTYEPDPNYCNTPPGTTLDSFSYTLNGGSSGTVTVTVTCVDDNPTAVDDAKTVTEDSGATAVDVLANDTNADGGPISVTSVTQPTNGTVVITGGGTGLTYAPNANYCNTPPGTTLDTFTYTLTPGGSTATVSVTVTCVDDNPVAVDDAKTVTEDGAAAAVDVLANDTDIDGGPISVTSVTQPTNGTVVITGGGTGLTYAPNANYCNTPPGTTLDTFTYTLTPGGSTATVSVTVTCVDDNPVAVDDVKTVFQNAAATAVDVLANDTDIDGGPISVTSVTQPTNGTVVITGGGTGLTYAPNANYCNDPPGTTLDTFTYTLTPGGSSATVSVTVLCDVPPTAVDDNATVTEDSGANAVNVLANDTDPDGGPMQVDSVTQPTNGTVVITGGGTGLTYAPAANYCNNPPGIALDTFTYTLNGGDSGTVTVTVDCVDDNPVAVADTATVTEDSGATAVGVLANDTDIDGGPMSVGSVTQPTNGTVVITGGGTGLTYAPAANYCNDPPGTTPDTFTYTLNGGSSATVSMTVTCVNDAPVADDEAFSGAQAAVGNTAFIGDDPTDGPPTVSGPEKTVTGDILAGDTDVDGPGPLVVTAGTFSSNDGGTVVLEADGDFAFTPAAGTSCTDTSDFFDYTVSDQASTPATDTGRVTIAITGCVWYVDNNHTGDDGTSTAPFDTLAQAQTASAAGDTVFLFDGDGTTTGYAAGIDLKDGQRLLGEAADLQIGADLLYTGVPANRPTVTDNNADVVSLASGNTVRGVQLDPQGTGGGIAGGAGDASGTIDDVRIIDTGTAGTQAGLELDATTGTFDISSLTVDSSAATGATSGSVGVRLNNAGTVNFADAGTISITTKGAKGLDAIGPTTSLGAGSVFDDITVTGSGSGAVSMTTTTGTTTFSNLDLTTTSGTAGGFVLSNAGTVTVSAAGVANVSATGGPAVDVSGTSGASLAFDAVSSSNSAGSGITLSGLGAGTFTATSGTIAGAATTAFVVAGASSGTITYPGAINDGSGNTASIAGRTGGTLTLSGTLSDSGDANGGVAIGSNSGGTTVLSGASKTFSTGAGTAVSLTNNTGHTVSITGGGLAITATSGAGLDMNGGGTLTVTGTGNTITTGTGGGLLIDNSTIGAGDVTFEKVSTNGASVGIRANNTGASGRLIVTGSGGTCTVADTSGCSGGTIQNGTGADSSSATPGGTGIVLNSTLNPSFTRMWVHDHSNYGIRGTSVAGFTLANSVVNGTNGTNGTTPFDDSSVWFDNLTGSAAVSSTHVSGGYEDNFRVVNTAGSLNRITFTSVTIGDNSTAGGNDGILLETSSSAGQLQATVTSSTFTGAAGDLLQFNHNGSGAGDLVLTGNAFSNNHSGIATGGGGLTLTSSGTGGATTMSITGNTFRDAVGNALTIVKTTGASSQTGTFSGNTVGVSGTPNSGSAEGDGIKLQTVGQGTLTWTVDNNQIYGYNNFGVDVIAGGSATLQSGAVNTTITNNTIAEPGNTSGTLGIAKNGVQLNIGTVPGDTYAACAAITGNSLANGGADAVPSVGGGQDVRLRQRQATTIRLPGYAGANNDNSAVATFVAGNNPTGGPSVIASNTSPTGGGFVGGAACPQ